MKEEGLIKDAYEAILKEFQTIITISYIIAVGIGMLFNYQKYEEFNINIFQYADVFDFLISPFIDLKILLFSFGTVAIIFILFKFDDWIEKKFPTFYHKGNLGLTKKSWFNIYRYILFIGLFLQYMYLTSNIYGKISKKAILKQDPIEIRFIDTEIQQGVFIGKTKDVLFFLRDEKVKIIPLNSVVKEIRYN